MSHLVVILFLLNHLKKYFGYFLDEWNSPSSGESTEQHKNTPAHTQKKKINPLLSYRSNSHTMIHYGLPYDQLSHKDDGIGIVVCHTVTPKSVFQRRTFLQKPRICGLNDSLQNFIGNAKQQCLWDLKGSSTAHVFVFLFSKSLTIIHKYKVSSTV